MFPEAGREVCGRGGGVDEGNVVGEYADDGAGPFAVEGGVDALAVGAVDF